MFRLASLGAGSAILLDGKYLTIADDEYSMGLRIWDLATGKVLWRSPDAIATLSRARSVCFSPDSKVLAADGEIMSPDRYEKGISLWDPATGKFLKNLADSKGWKVGAISPDGRWLASPGRVWNLETGQAVDTGAGHNDPIRQLAFMPRFDLIASADTHDTIRFWDPVTGVHKRLLNTGLYWIHGLSFSPDGRYVAAGRPGHGDGFIAIWESGTGRQVYKLPGHEAPYSRQFTITDFSPDSRFLLSWGEDFYLRKWDLKTGKAVLEKRTVPTGVEMPKGYDDELQTVRGIDLSRDGPIADAAFTPQADQLLMLSGEGNLHCFKVATGKESRVIKIGGRIDSSNSLSVSPTGTHVATISRGNGSSNLTVCELASGKVTFKVSFPGYMGDARFSPDGRTLAAGSGMKVAVMEVATGKIRLEIAAKSRLAFSPDGRFIVTAMPDMTALVWDLAVLAGRK